MTTPPLRFVLVAGELSGDLLGARLITALRALFPDAIFEGVGGPQMLHAGLHSWADMQRLAVMGLVEILRHLPDLLALRKEILKHTLAQPVTAFIGIDAPDFNLRVAAHLKQKGVKTFHYVSPSVWAWRSHRIHGISRSLNGMLTLFPFETACYQQVGLPAACVGHPLADDIPLAQMPVLQQLQIRQTQQFTAEPLLLLLPGSRISEVARHAPLFIATAQQLQQQMPNLQIAISAATDSIAKMLHSAPFPVVRGGDWIAAADLVLCASGTVTLEALLRKKPMVVAYRLNSLTAWLARRLVRVRWFSLPNILCNRALVPEFFQQEATPEALANAVETLWSEPQEALITQFEQIHKQLRCSAGEKAAHQLIEWLALEEHPKVVMLNKPR